MTIGSNSVQYNVYLSQSDETKLSITPDGVISAKRAWENTVSLWHAYECGALNKQAWQLYFEDEPLDRHYLYAFAQ